MTPVDRWIPLTIVALVACERLAELVVSRRNQRALMARGAVEIGAAHYPYMVALHVAWAAAIIVWASFAPAQVSVPLAIVYALVQVLRVWVMMALGPYWTTRIITLPHAPLIAHGPYRFVRHPNYAVVVIEVALLPLVFGAWQIAAAFSLLNAVMLWVRISAENAALAPRPR